MKTATALALPEPTEHDDTEDGYYGYRTIIEYDENGRATFSYRDLTLDDFLEPEEGDVYMQGNLHTDDVIRLRSIFKYHLRNRGNMTVYCDMKIIWGVEGLKNPAPDISVIADVTEPDKPRSSFYVPEEGVKPFFVLEVVSPRYRKADIDKKPAIYRKAGVSEYIIADPGLKGNEISYTVKGYRLISNRYVKIKPDSQGRINSVTTGIQVGVSESGDRLIVYDAKTGEEILSDDERAEKAEEEKARAEEEKARAEKKKAQAEKEKAQAEKEKAQAEKEKAQAEKEKARAEQEKNQAEIRADHERTRADSAEDELRRLKEMLRAKGIQTD